MLTLDAIITADGTLVAKLPRTFSGKHVRIIIEDAPPPSQWESISAILQEIDALDLPERTHEEILSELRAFKETT